MTDLKSIDSLTSHGKIKGAAVEDQVESWDKSHLHGGDGSLLYLPWGKSKLRDTAEFASTCIITFLDFNLLERLGTRLIVLIDSQDNQCKAQVRLF